MENENKKVGMGEHETERQVMKTHLDTTDDNSKVDWRPTFSPTPIMMMMQHMAHFLSYIASVHFTLCKKN